MAWKVIEFQYGEERFSFVEFQIETTHTQFIDTMIHGDAGHVISSSDLDFLATRLEFVEGVYEVYSPSVGPWIRPTLDRDYQKLIDESLALFRSHGESDLGDNARDLLRKHPPTR